VQTPSILPVSVRAQPDSDYKHCGAVQKIEEQHVKISTDDFAEQAALSAPWRDIPPPAMKLVSNRKQNGILRLRSRLQRSLRALPSSQRI